MTETSVDRINRRARIEQAPRIKFVFGRDWYWGPDNWCVGVMWDRNLDANEGEIAYRRQLVFRWRFRIWCDRR